MEYSNLSVIGMVLVLVAVVLGIAFTGLYVLNKTVDKNGSVPPQQM